MMNPDEQMIMQSKMQALRDENIYQSLRNDTSRNYRRLVKKANKKKVKP